MTRKADNGLVWSGLVWISLSVCARFVNTHFRAVRVGSRGLPCPFGAICLHEPLRRKGQVVTG